MNTCNQTLDDLLVPAEGRTNIINPFFEEWNDHILSTLRCRIDSNLMNYENNGDMDLLHDCLIHSERYAKPLNSKNVLILMHPSYIFVSGMGDVKEWHKKDVEQYKSSMIEVFNNHSFMDYNIVIFDTVHHYADGSSRLLEEGIADRIFFTEYDSGAPRFEENLSDFNNKRLFFGGGYNGQHCLPSIIWRCLEKVLFEDKLRAVYDLIIECPECAGTGSLKPTSIVSKSGHNIKDEYLPSEDIISLQEFFSMVRTN